MGLGNETWKQTTIRGSKLGHQEKLGNPFLDSNQYLVDFAGKDEDWTAIYIRIM